MAATAHRSQANFPFPPEIRERIYKFVLTSEDDMPTTTRTDGPDTRCLSLLLVCKQICLEAFHIFYRHNNLNFANLGALWLFLKNIGYARRLYVAHITFAWQGLEDKQTFRLLQRCPNLKSLDIILPGSYYEPGKCYDSEGRKTLSEVRGIEVVNFWGLVLHAENLPHPQGPRINSSLMPNRYAQLVGNFLGEMEILRNDMMRPRLKRYAPKADENINLFKPRKEITRKSEVQLLREQVRDRTKYV